MIVRGTVFLLDHGQKLMMHRSLWGSHLKKYHQNTKNSIRDARTPQPREIFSTP